MPVSVLTIEEEIERPPELVESKNDDRYRFQNKETYSNEVRICACYNLLKRELDNSA